MTVLLVDLESIPVRPHDPSFQDQLLQSERDAIVPPAQFWNCKHARPTIATRGAGGLIEASTMAQRNQGARVNCVSFAIVAAMELRAWREGIVVDLSEQYVSSLLFHARCQLPDADPSLEILRLVDGVALMKGVWICIEDECTYDDLKPLTSPPELASGSANYAIEDYFVIGRLPPSMPEWPMTPCVDGPGISNTSYLECILSQGYDIIIVLCLSGTTWPLLPTPDVVRVACMGGVADFCAPGFPNKSHAVVITGYVRVATVPYFVCRNSLPSISNGALLLSYDYVRTYATYGVVVTSIGIRRPSREMQHCPQTLEAAQWESGEPASSTA